MTLLEIFEKVNLAIPLEQRHFFNHYNDTVDELMAEYGGFVLDSEGEYTPPKELSDSVSVLPLYHTAIVDNIVFLASSGEDEARKSEFIRKSHNAYLHYWNENAKGKRVKRMRW